MTTTIHRPLWLAPRLWLGLAAILIAVTVGVYQNTGNQLTDLATLDRATEIDAPGLSYWERLQMRQDGFLPPTVTSQVASGEELVFQMPPRYVQEGYLPPAVLVTPAGADPNGRATSNSGPR